MGQAHTTSWRNFSYPCGRVHCVIAVLNNSIFVINSESKFDFNSFLGQSFSERFVIDKEPMVVMNVFLNNREYSIQFETSYFNQWSMNFAINYYLFIEILEVTLCSLNFAIDYYLLTKI